MILAHQSHYSAFKAPTDSSREKFKLDKRISTSNFEFSLLQDVHPEEPAPIVPLGGHPPVTLIDGKDEVTIPYLDCFRKIPAIGMDGKEVIRWYGFKFLKLDLDEMEALINSVQWDQEGMHTAYCNAENNLLRKGANCVAIYAKKLRLSSEWWDAFEMKFHKLAALRDYHDFRMGISKPIYKEYAHLFQGDISVNNLRHYSHLGRIWNCTVFVRDLRRLLEGKAHVIPKSVWQLLVNGKNIPYVSETDLKKSLTKISAVRNARARSKSVGCHVTALAKLSNL